MEQINELNVDQLNKFLSIVNELNQEKFYILVIFVFVLIVLYASRWYLLHKSSTNISKNLFSVAKNIEELKEKMTKHDNQIKTNVMKQTSDLILIMEKQLLTMEEIRDRQRNKLSKTDSIKIIVDKFNDVVKRETVSIIEWSLEHNNYKNRKDFVRNKVKTKIAEVFSTARESLEPFKLSIDLDDFFLTYEHPKSGDILFTLVDQIWEEVEFLYEKEISKEESAELIKEQKIEEMRIVVNNVITAFITRKQVEMKNIYKDN